MLDEMMQESGGEEDQYLQVLQEIKDVMDQRLGDKLKSSNAPKPEMSEAPMPEEPSMEEPPMEEKSDSGLAPNEEEELRKIRESMV